MADLDSEDKRRSAPNMFIFVINPVADGTIGATDREQATGIYAGISPGAPSVGKSFQQRLKAVFLIITEEE